jgi:hypothetical protein
VGNGRSCAVAYSLLCVDGSQRPALRAIGVPAAYLLLFLLGAMEGLIGCFQFPHTVGSVPVAALGFCALILVTCLLGGAGMGSALGGLAPAVGWLLVSLVLTLPTGAGSVIVTNTPEGKWYLYGGAVCAGAGVAICFGRARRPIGSRRRGSYPPT